MSPSHRKPSSTTIARWVMPFHSRDRMVPAFNSTCPRSKATSLAMTDLGVSFSTDTIKELANRRIEVARLICLSPIAYDGCL